MKDVINNNSQCKYPLKKGVYYIYDDDKKNKPLFLNKKDRWNLCIINKKSEIYFYQNDECVMKNKNNFGLNDGKRVDWVCFDTTDFYFIEAKDDRITDKMDVEKKLINSLNFYQRNYDLTQFKIHWILNKYRKHIITNTGDNTRKARLLNNYNINYNETYIICFNN